MKYCEVALNMAKKKLVPGAKKFAALFALRLLCALMIDSSGMEKCSLGSYCCLYLTLTPFRPQ